jgi:hypothetical protein
VYSNVSNDKTPQSSPRPRQISAATRRRIRGLRLAAHVIEVIGADHAIHATDIPLVLLRPVNTQEAYAAAAEITAIRNRRPTLYGRRDCDNVVLQDGQRVLHAEISLLRSEAGWLAADGWQYGL